MSAEKRRKMKNQSQQGKFEGSLDVTLELSLGAGGDGERGQGPGSVMLGRRVASPRGISGPIGLRAVDTHPRRARRAAAEPAGAARRRAQAGCRAPAIVAPRSWWERPRAVRVQRGPRDAGTAAGDAAGVAAGALGPANSRGSRWRHPGGCSPAPPSRRAPGSCGAKRGCARGPEGGQWVPPRGGRSPRRVDWAQAYRQNLL